MKSIAKKLHFCSQLPALVVLSTKSSGERLTITVAVTCFELCQDFLVLELLGLCGQKQQLRS